MLLKRQDFQVLADLYPLWSNFDKLKLSKRTAFLVSLELVDYVCREHVSVFTRWRAGFCPAESQTVLDMIPTEFYSAQHVFPEIILCSSSKRINPVFHTDGFIHVATDVLKATVQTQLLCGLEGSITSQRPGVGLDFGARR